MRGAVPPEEPVEPMAPRGNWWLPVALAVVGLLLLLAIAVGVWLVMANSQEPAPSPVPSAPPTSASVTSEAPSPTGTPAPSPVTTGVPQVVGLSQSQATDALDLVGLNYRLEFRQSADVSPGTVIGVDPAEGVQVPLGYEVLLVVASAPQTSAPPTEAPSPTPSPSPSATLS